MNMNKLKKLKQLKKLNKGVNMLNNILKVLEMVNKWKTTLDMLRTCWESWQVVKGSKNLKYRPPTHHPGFPPKPKEGFPLGKPTRNSSPRGIPTRNSSPIAIIDNNRQYQYPICFSKYLKTNRRLRMLLGPPAPSWMDPWSKHRSWKNGHDCQTHAHGESNRPMSKSLTRALTTRPQSSLFAKLVHRSTENRP